MYSSTTDASLHHWFSTTGILLLRHVVGHHTWYWQNSNSVPGSTRFPFFEFENSIWPPVEKHTWFRCLLPFEKFI